MYYLAVQHSMLNIKAMSNQATQSIGSLFMLNFYVKIEE